MISKSTLWLRGIGYFVPHPQCAFLDVALALSGKRRIQIVVRWPVPNYFPPKSHNTTTTDSQYNDTTTTPQHNHNTTATQQHCVVVMLWLCIVLWLFGGKMAHTGHRMVDQRSLVPHFIHLFCRKQLTERNCTMKLENWLKYYN